MEGNRAVAIAAMTVMVMVHPSTARQNVLETPPNLHVEGIPPIPRDLVDSVNRYTESRSATPVAWHPTRREILILTRFGNTNQVHRVAMPGGARTQLTFFPDRVVDASYPPVERGFFVFNKDVGGSEWFQNYRLDEATGEITLLTDGKSRNSLGVWSRDGKFMAYSSTRRTGKDSDIYVIDPADPSTNRLVLEVEGGGWGAVDWSPDGRSLLVLNYISITNTELYIVDVQTGAKRLISKPPTGQAVAYLFARWAPDGRILVTSDRDSEFQRLAALDPDTGRETVLVGDIPWDISTFEVAPDGRTVAFLANENGTSALHLLDLADGRHRRVTGLPPGVDNDRLLFRPDSSEVALGIQSARTPGDVFSVDVRTARVERWTYSEAGGLNLEAFSEPELITWTSFDGRAISGYLYRPPARFTGRRPVIVNIHGGPESQYRPGYLGRNNYWMNELGVAMIFPNVRGSSGYGKTFVSLDNGFKREDSYKDINALFDWIATRPDLDASRVAVVGGSYGGFMTLAVASTYPDRIACAVSLVGISNLRTFLENTEAYRRDLRRAEYGDERDPEMRAFMERIAPVNKADRMTKPLFVVQGKNDPRVPWTESQQIVDTLKQRGTPVWYLLAEDEGHGFAKKTNADYFFYASVMFMREFLLDETGTR
ncbi:MAG TPA: S9 family peptidase [Vicinamibacterales bacterium]|nr:S9 family peptidase [Vicinamibacterales bacterium]